MTFRTCCWCGLQVTQSGACPCQSERSNVPTLFVA